ncbi:MAG TPA: redoxin family protein [Gemmatimonadaceae bacterium]|jgi:thiol-disulfide isomerase/thioredoxin|nr:redoxin family protein [Gemmatimonadaceae bacterium]
MLRTTILTALAVLLAGGSAPAIAAHGTPTLGPVYAASQGWLNGRLTPADAAGKVVIVDVFTFDCYNCQNVVPNLRALNAKKTDGLLIVGIHSPETPFETNRTNVIANLQKQGITWPVAIDNSFAIWHAYNVDAWPTQLFFDRTGKLRATIVGDSQDGAVNGIVRKLLAER